MDSGGPCFLIFWTTLLPQVQLIEDFRALRQAAEDMKLFQVDHTFFGLLLGHILAMELLAWLIVYLSGPGWVSSILAALILALSQVIPRLCSRYGVQHMWKHSGHIFFN